MDSKQSVSRPLTIAIMGASGFIGRHLSQQILETTDYAIRTLCRHPEELAFDPTLRNRVQPVPVDILDKAGLEQALKGADIAVYLVHMMGGRADYYHLEAEAAHNFGKAARAAGVRRIVYMGGLGNDKDKLSRHLASRHHTGKILREYVPESIEFRASMIVGDGSIAYDIMKNFVRLLPVQTMPSWAVTQTQPITLHDALRYLVAGLTVPVSGHEIVEIGGPEQLSYKDLIKRYAAFCHKKPILILVPIVPIWLGSLWLNLFTPRRHAKVGRQMVESLANPMVVTTPRAQQMFPDIHPAPAETAFT